MVELLLSWQADINAQDAYGSSPIYCAQRCRHELIINGRDLTTATITDTEATNQTGQWTWFDGFWHHDHGEGSPIPEHHLASAGWQAYQCLDPEFGGCYLEWLWHEGRRIYFFTGRRFPFEEL